MPIRKKDYPANWQALSLKVRAEANNRCEWCGAPNGRVISRLNPKDARKIFCHPDYPGWDFFEKDEIQETDGSIVLASALTWQRLRFHGLTKIILTVAHLDRDSQNNDRINLSALYQRCHLRHDIRQHIANRKYGRYHKDHQLKLEV